ncbi:lanthionine synthetase LanC family protein [Chitinophaga vietnamensis]|uniref:lanthionine synthetase LanC family protein n=1 Tax=Chitinophaga vietnamensis TaxID=2593957 RepID=UPI0011780576|nr:lanthionine synthetase LanC family protein [Chitinophaga vietnamensis]
MNTGYNIITHEEVITDITRCLEGTEAALHNPSYETGLLGYALYYLYLGKYTGKEEYMQQASLYFDKGMASLDLKHFSKVYQTDSLDGHLAHIGRFLIFCKKHALMDVESDAYLQSLDGILSTLMKSKVSIRDFDINSGAIASGQYYLARLKSGANVREQLEYLVEGIAACAEKDADGDYYWISPALYNRVYLGISHGSCMIISFLVSAYENGISKETCEAVIRKAVNFLLKQYRVTEYKGLFPNFIGDQIDNMQFALCYGDIGVGYTLYRAASYFADERLATYRDLVLNDCLLRSREENLTLDAGIFYGAAGVASIFDKLGALSGDPRFVERARYWYRQIPGYAVHENPYAGFKSRLLADDVVWQVSFGWGLLGIGVASMIYLDRSLPPIDELLMIA